jgi:hypothetical protein
MILPTRYTNAVGNEARLFDTDPTNYIAFEEGDEVDIWFDNKNSTYLTTLFVNISFTGGDPANIQFQYWKNDDITPENADTWNDSGVAVFPFTGSGEKFFCISSKTDGAAYRFPMDLSGCYFKIKNVDANCHSNLYAMAAIIQRDASNDMILFKSGTGINNTGVIGRLDDGSGTITGTPSALLQCPSWVIESIARDEMGLATAEIDTAAFDAAATALGDSIFAFEIMDQKRSMETLDDLAYQAGLHALWDSLDRLKILKYDAAKYFPNSGTDTPALLDEFTSTGVPGSAGSVTVDIPITNDGGMYRTSLTSYEYARDYGNGDAIIPNPYYIGMPVTSNTVWRSFLQGIIPAMSAAISASLFLSGNSNNADTTTGLHILGGSQSDPLVVTDFHAFDGFTAGAPHTGTKLNEAWDSTQYHGIGDPDPWNELVFNAAGIAAIFAAAGTTMKLCLISSQDYDNDIPPATHEYLAFYSSGMGDAKVPFIRLTYVDPNKDTFTTHQILSKPQLSKMKISEVKNDFILNYSYNYGSKQFAKTLQVNKDGNNLDNAICVTLGTTAAAQGTLCSDSYTAVGTVNSFSYDAWAIRDDATATALIIHLIDRLSVMRWLLEWQAGPSANVLEEGDFVNVRCDLAETVFGTAPMNAKKWMLLDINSDPHTHDVTFRAIEV